MVTVWRDFHYVGKDAGATRNKEKSNEEDVNIGLSNILSIA